MACRSAIPLLLARNVMHAVHVKEDKNANSNPIDKVRFVISAVRDRHKERQTVNDFFLYLDVDRYVDTYKH